MRRSLGARCNPRNVGSICCSDPGSILETSADNTLPIAYGLPDKVDVFFASSPAFRLP